MPASKVCAFGGTFDPIHNAHLRIALEAASRFGLDQVLFIPAGNPPHKASAGIVSYQDRFEMVALACEPYAPLFAPSRLEEGSTHSYTVETLSKLRNTLAPEITILFLIGSDAFEQIETWHRWQDVLKLAEFIVVERPGHESKIPTGAIVHRLDGLSLPISSSSIRDQLAAGEATPELPAEVRSYIDKRGLYGAVIV